MRGIEPPAARHKAAQHQLHLQCASGTGDPPGCCSANLFHPRLPSDYVVQLWTSSKMVPDCSGSLLCVGSFHGRSADGGVLPGGLELVFGAFELFCRARALESPGLGEASVIG